MDSDVQTLYGTNRNHVCNKILKTFFIKSQLPQYPIGSYKMKPKNKYHDASISGMYVPRQKMLCCVKNHSRDKNVIFQLLP
jgi:hypothetical protein